MEWRLQVRDPRFFGSENGNHSACFLVVSGDENGTGVVSTTRSGDGPEFKVHLVFRKSTLKNELRTTACLYKRKEFPANGLSGGFEMLVEDAAYFGDA